MRINNQRTQWNYVDDYCYNYKFDPDIDEVERVKWQNECYLNTSLTLVQLKEIIEKEDNVDVSQIEFDAKLLDEKNESTKVDALLISISYINSSQKNSVAYYIIYHYSFSFSYIITSQTVIGFRYGMFFPPMFTITALDRVEENKYTAIAQHGFDYLVGYYKDSPFVLINYDNKTIVTLSNFKTTIYEMMFVENQQGNYLINIYISQK
ncbi:MAG: hypothetical protein FWF56_01480 [Firmicutes bacterium]|nr:hypothetical protein [Bacillota bacterium]MCL1954010.1 hypothetical protein [Bacillota bacterium]